MAFEYQGFATLGVNLNRQKYGPLDISNVFISEADLKYYLTKGTFIEGVSEYWYKDDVNKVVPYPYDGQVLATVINGEVNVYVLASKEDGTFETREIAGKIEVDGTTIVKDAEGKLSIVAPVDPDSTKTYNFAYANGVYSWVEVDTATAAGQAQAIEGLTKRTVAIEEAINGKGEGDERVKGLVEKVADLEAIDNATQAELDTYKEEVTAAIAEALQSAKDYADTNDANTIYDDTDVKARIKAIEDDYLKEEDKYDDTELSGKVSALETTVGSAESGLVKAVADNTQAIIDAEDRAKSYTDEEIAGLKVSIEQKDGVEYIIVKGKDNEEITSVNASKFVQDSFLNDVSYNAETGKVSFVWTMGDGSSKTDEIDIAHLVDVYTAGNGLKVENNEFSVDTEVVATVEELNKVKETAEAAQTAEEVASAISTAITGANLAQYAVKTEVESALAGKVDTTTLDGYYTKTDIEGKGYAVATEVENTYATKAMLEEHEENIADELLNYAKSETVNAELAKKVETGSIAHTTEELSEGVTVNGTSLDIVVDAFTKAETRKYVADTISQMTGGESAADVLLALNNYKSDNDERVGAIETKNSEQDTAITAAQTQADKGVADAAKVATDLATANTAIADNTREIGVVKGSISTVNEALSGKITALENKDTTIESNITALDTIVRGEGGHTSRIVALEGRATALENRDVELATLIQGNTDKFAGYYTKGEVDTKVQEAIDAIPDVDFTPYATNEYVNAELAKKANATDVYTKDEANAAFMSQDEVDSRINTLIVGADPEGGKTIENIQNLVKYVDENAGEIASLITAVEANTNKLVGITTTVTDYVSDAIGAIPAATAETLGLVKVGETMSITEDGVINVVKVSTDILVQGEKELIINGGSAN